MKWDGKPPAEYSEEEVALLLRCVADGMSSETATEHMLGRSAASLQNKARLLGHPFVRSPPPESEFWRENGDLAFGLLGEGKRYQEIADDLRITKNALIGWIHRHMMAGTFNTPLPTMDQRLRFHLTENRGCAWPIGDVPSEDFRWCGETLLPLRPYCLTHCREAYIDFDRINPEAREAYKVALAAEIKRELQRQKSEDKPL